MMEGDARIGSANRMAAASVALFCLVAMLVWGVPGLDPSMWDEAAVVAGLRPPRTIFPGFWRFIAGWLFPLFGAERAVAALNLLGAGIGAACVYSVFLTIRQILALIVRFEKPYPVWNRLIAPFFAGVAALCFGLSDPFWSVCRVFSPSEIRLVLFLFVIHALLRWFVAGGNWRLFPAFAAMGVLAAETPFAFLLPLIFAFAYVSVWHRVMDGLLPLPENLPEPEDLPKWRMFFLFLGGMAVAVFANASAFVSLGGVEANGWRLEDIYFRYAGGYWHVFWDAATVVGWMLGLSFAVLPFLVALRMSSLVIRDDRQMPFDCGVIVFFVGILATMQCGAFPSACFWTFTKDASLVESGFLLVLFVFCAMTALAIFGAAFAFECQRVYQTAEGEGRSGVLLKGIVPAIAVVLLALVVVHRPKTVETEMQRIVDAALEEIVEECGDAKYLFTDGHLDPAIELVAAARGKKLYALNMMSGDSDWESCIRKRPFRPETDDCRSAEMGIPVLLRIWAGEKKGGLDKAALQLGFEYWKREHKPLPKMSGLLARPNGMSDEEARRGIERARALAERILKVAPQIGLGGVASALYNAFSAVNWRVSRFARLREEDEMADDLDHNNGVLKKMFGLIEQERMRTFMQMTPREGLRIALRRADFSEARRYATIVLSNDGENPEANFAMGMSELARGHHDPAARYLILCLKRRPKEPAVLNNLSIIMRKLKRYEEAEKFARQAIQLLPDSPEVKKTLADALKKAP